MPPKSNEPAKARTPPLIAGLAMEEISSEQLEEHIVRLQEELERKERNYFQLERDKIHTFCRITEKQLEEAKADHKNLDKENEDDERCQQVDIKVHKQKMKRLLNEHQNTISELKADGLASTEAAQKEQAQLENELHKRMGSIGVEMQGLDIENPVKELELKHDEKMTKTRNSQEVQLTEIPAKYEKKLELWRRGLDNTKKNVASERKDFWNDYITTLMKNHDTNFSDGNAFKKDMEQELDICCSHETQTKTISSVLKKEVLPCCHLLRRRCVNNDLSMIKEKTEVEEKRHHYIQKEDLSEKVRAKDLADQKRDSEALQKKFSELERDKLYETFTQNDQKVQHNVDLKSMQLLKGLEAATDTQEKTQAQLSVLFDSNMDQTALCGVTNKIEEDITSSKDEQAKISEVRKEYC